MENHQTDERPISNPNETLKKTLELFGSTNTRKKAENNDDYKHPESLFLFPEKKSEGKTLFSMTQTNDTNKRQCDNSKPQLDSYKIQLKELSLDNAKLKEKIQNLETGLGKAKSSEELLQYIKHLESQVYLTNFNKYNRRLV